MTLIISKEDKIVSYKINASCKHMASDQEGHLFQQIKNIPIEEISKKYLYDFLEDITPDEEQLFFLQHEWDALKTCVAHYCNKEDDATESGRCHIDSIHTTENQNTIIEATLLPQQAT